MFDHAHFISSSITKSVPEPYPRLKRRVSQTFEQETCLLSRSTFCGRFMRQNGFRAKLCVREIIFDSSIQAQWAGEVIRQNWRGYGLSDTYTLGTDFKPAPRKPLESVLHRDRW